MKTFCAAIAATLPETIYSYFFIVLYNPLLLLLTEATAAAAFNDHETARAKTYEHNTIDLRLQDALKHFISGGGVCYSLDKDGCLFISESEQYGPIYFVWTTLELAEEMTERYKGSIAIAYNYRELHERLSNLSWRQVQSVAVDFGGKEPAIVPVDEFILLLANQIKDVDKSKFGVAYYSAVGV